MNGYVQDERYAAGAGMRRSGFFQIGTVSGMCGAIVSVLHATNTPMNPSMASSGHNTLNSVPICTHHFIPTKENAWVTSYPPYTGTTNEIWGLAT